MLLMGYSRYIVIISLLGRLKCQICHYRKSEENDVHTSVNFDTKFLSSLSLLSNTLFSFSVILVI